MRWFVLGKDLAQSIQIEALVRVRAAVGQMTLRLHDDGGMETRNATRSSSRFLM